MNIESIQDLNHEYQPKKSIIEWTCPLNDANMYMGRKTLLLIIVTSFAIYYIFTTKNYVIKFGDENYSHNHSDTPTTKAQNLSDNLFKNFSESEIHCYKAQDVGTIQQLDYNEPPRGKSIFFHETSCKSHKNGKLMINNRQACAVESAALLNPHFQIFLLYVSPGVFPNDKSDSNRYLEALLTYPNINIRHINYGSYLAKTPVENLYRDGLIEKSSYPLIHASDIIRYLTLWRFGGIYLDLDVVVTKSLETLPLNYAGQESEDFVAAGVLSFESTGIGHDWATQCLEDLKSTFNGKIWGYNGPGVITRLFKKLCNATSVGEVIRDKEGSCKGYKVYAQEYFYPVPWKQWRMYFDDKFNNQVDNLTENSYAIHVWNKMSKSTNVSVGSEVSYVRFAKRFCPRVFKQCADVF